jgi:hypothetical protein
MRIQMSDVLAVLQTKSDESEMKVGQPGHCCEGRLSRSQTQTASMRQQLRV